jgi:histone H3/H4
MAYVVKSAVRTLLKGMRASEDFFKELDTLVAESCKKAIARAKANGRKTVRGADL